MRSVCYIFLPKFAGRHVLFTPRSFRSLLRVARARRALATLSRKTARIMDVSKLQEKKAALEEELQRTEENIYDLEGEYLQACTRAATDSHKPWRG